jgi:hypothetical protein
VTQAPAPVPARTHGRLALVALVLAACVSLVWPGDVPFINDEPLLIGNAVTATLEGRVASMGLQGTFGFAYGPFPTWIYQLLTGLSHDLVIVAAAHALLLSAATAAALWYLARALGLWPWFAAVPLLSPYYWFYARALWDNPFLIPLGAIVLAGYASYLAAQSSPGLRVAVAGLVAIPLVHLMGLALVVPLGAHMLLVHRRALWAHKWSLLAIVSIALWLGWAYWMYLVGPAPAVPPAVRVPEGFLFPLLGGRLLSARELAYFYGPGPVSDGLFETAATVSSLALVFVWCGIAVALWHVARALRTRSWTPRAHLAAIALAALVAQSIINGLSAKYEHPHYHLGLWPVFALLAWYAVDAMARAGSRTRRVAWVATGLLAAVNLAAVGGLAIRLHRTHGTREVYGPTLANQQQVARALARFAPDSEVRNHVIMWEKFPHTLDLLRRLNPSSGSTLPRRRVDLTYASGNPSSGAIVLIERPGSLIPTAKSP